ncbi:MAG: tetratricopeptide repeat protein, partial [Deltaproteobacteria bacterium]
RLHFVRGEMAESEAAARRVLSFENLGTEQKIGALTIAAMACHDRRRWSEAADYFAELTRLRRNGEDWYYLGECAYELRDAEGAIRALETSRRIDPDALPPCTLLARIYRSRNARQDEKRVLDDIERLTRRARGGNAR